MISSDLFNFIWFSLIRNDFFDFPWHSRPRVANVLVQSVCLGGERTCEFNDLTDGFARGTGRWHTAAAAMSTEIMAGMLVIWRKLNSRKKTGFQGISTDGSLFTIVFFF